MSHFQQPFSPGYMACAYWRLWLGLSISSSMTPLGQDPLERSCKGLGVSEFGSGSEMLGNGSRMLGSGSRMLGSGS